MYRAWRFVLCSALQEEEKAGGVASSGRDCRSVASLSALWVSSYCGSAARADGWRVNHKRVARIRSGEGFQAR